MPKPVIQDKVVVVRTPREQLKSPIGEAIHKEDPIPVLPMQTPERLDMVQRLGNSISELMDEADKTYKANCYKPGTTEINPDYITRLTTHEFFFYTKEPLTLKEFEELQNQIAAKAKTLPSGVQLILGTFAVKTDDNKVMSVVPHITCGQSPEFHFLVKNYTSPIDVRYKIPDGTGNTETLGVFDILTNPPPKPMPKIEVNGEFRDFTFNNIVPCKTPGGSPFLTAIDICLDHKTGVAKADYFTKSNPELLRQPISHVIVSNSVRLCPSNCISPFVMQADPRESPYECKQGVTQTANPERQLKFGREPCTIYDLAPQAVDFSYLQKKEAFIKIYNALYEGQTSFFKSSKVDFQKFWGYDQIEQYIKTNPDQITKTALQIFNKFSEEEISSSNTRLVQEIHREAFNQSGYFKKTSIDYSKSTGELDTQFKAYKEKFMRIRNTGEKVEPKEEIEDRITQIFKALG